MKRCQTTSHCHVSNCEHLAHVLDDIICPSSLLVADGGAEESDVTGVNRQPGNVEAPAVVFDVVIQSIIFLKTETVRPSSCRSVALIVGPYS